MIHGLMKNGFQTRTDDAGFDYEVRIRCVCQEFTSAWHLSNESALTEFRRHLEERR